MSPLAATKMSLLVGLAKCFAGSNIREHGGPNKGEFVEWFQTAVDGKASGEPWCLGFVQRCLQIVDAQMAEAGEHGKTCLRQTEWTIGLYQQAPSGSELDNPESGCIVVWEHSENGKATGKGHVGIVVGVNPDGTFQTVEGNTSAGVGIQREGDGVYLRTRKRDSAGDMRILGFLTPWL
jgi:hypothetical protein